MGFDGSMINESSYWGRFPIFFVNGHLRRDLALRLLQMVEISDALFVLQPDHGHFNSHSNAAAVSPNLTKWGAFAPAKGLRGLVNREEKPWFSQLRVMDGMDLHPLTNCLDFDHF